MIDDDVQLEELAHQVYAKLNFDGHTRFLVEGGKYGRDILLIIRRSLLAGRTPLMKQMALQDERIRELAGFEVDLERLRNVLRMVEEWLVDLGADDGQAGPMNGDEGAKEILRLIQTELSSAVCGKEEIK